MIFDGKNEAKLELKFKKPLLQLGGLGSKAKRTMSLNMTFFKASLIENK